MRSSSPSAGAAAVLGVVALVTLPVAVVAAQVSSRLGLLQALYVAVPVDVVLALAALGAERRARFGRARRVQPGGAVVGRTARVLAYVGAYAAVTGALALGVYGILRWAQ